MQQLPWLRQVPSHFDGTTCHAGCPTLKKAVRPARKIEEPNNFRGMCAGGMIGGIIQT